MHIAQRQTSIEPTECEIVDQLVEYVSVCQREVVVNYYVALKAKRFVILAGPGDVDKMCLAQGLTEILVGQLSQQRCLFQAHPWWVTRTRDPAHFAMAHAQFNALKLLDFIEAASHSEAEGLAFPFFAGIERMSPAEVVCYFHDLPRGLLWQADASTVQVDLPKNLYITGTLNMEEGDGLVQIPEVDHYATIIRVDRRHFAPFAGPRKASPQRSAGQRRFVRSVIRRGDHARAKLTQILPDGYAPLAPLNELLRRLGMAGFSPFVFEEALLYLANAFDGDGRGLFVQPVVENLRIAQDYVLVQGVLPYVNSRWAGAPEVWGVVSDYLAPRFPRAYDWIVSASARYNIRSRKSRADVAAIEAGV